MAVEARPIALCSLLVVACEGVDGDRSPQQPQLYASASNTYRIEYLAPPWSVKSDDGETLELEIPAEVFGLALESSPPSHVLRIGQVNTAGDIANLAESHDVDVDTGGLELPATTGGLTSGELPDSEGLPDYLLDVNLRSHRDVAFAELNHLLEDQGGVLHSELQPFATAGGQQGAVFVVVVDPGVYVRSFYFSTETEAVRAAFVSPFDLQTEDVDLMAETILTNDPETRD